MNGSPTPGFYTDIPEHDYHTDPAVSQSQLKTLTKKSPAHYRWELDNPREQTDAMRLGTLVHAKVLNQPDPYVVVNHPGNTKAGREERAAADGKPVITAKAAQTAQAMAEAVLAHPTARAILEDEGHNELSMWWVDDETGIDCRGRLDRLTTRAAIDVKTTQDASPHGFARSVVSFGYDFQDAMYTAGRRALGADDGPLVFVAVESEPPHLVAVHVLPQWWRDEADLAVRDALDWLARCRADDDWPGYPDDITTLTHPYRRY